MTVGELIEELKNFDPNLEAFCKKTEGFGNISATYSAKLDSYSFFGKLLPCVIISDEAEDDENEE